METGDNMGTVVGRLTYTYDSTAKATTQWAVDGSRTTWSYDPRVSVKQGIHYADVFFDLFGHAFTDTDYALNEITLPGSNPFGDRNGLSWDGLGTGTRFARVAEFIRDAGGCIGDISSRVLEGVIAVAQVSLVKLGTWVGFPAEAFLNAIELLGQYGSQFATRAQTIIETLFLGLIQGTNNFAKNIKKHFKHGVAVWLGKVGELLLKAIGGGYGGDPIAGLLKLLTDAVGFSWDELTELVEDVSSRTS